jgi:hypothetical protein
MRKSLVIVPTLAALSPSVPADPQFARAIPAAFHAPASLHLLDHCGRSGRIVDDGRVDRRRDDAGGADKTDGGRNSHGR